MGTDYSSDDTADSSGSTGSAGFDTAALASKLEGQFNEAFDGVTDAQVEADAAANPEPEPTKPSAQFIRRKEVNKTQQAEELEQEGLVSPDEPDGVEDPGSTPETTEQAEGEATETPAGETAEAEASSIDPFHKWAAQQSGWTPEQISRLEKADPELAAQTFAGVANAYTALSRQAINQVVPGTAGNSPEIAAAQASNPTPKLDKIVAGLTEFAEANGEDLAGLVRALNEELITPYKASLARQQVVEQKAQAAEANNTFAAVSKEFPDFYGKGNPNPVQQDRIQTLARLADQIRSGAKQQGREVSIADCVKQAHAVLTTDLRVANARKQVASQVQKRSKTISARPTQRTLPARSGPPSVAKAIAAFELKAAELGVSEND